VWANCQSYAGWIWDIHNRRTQLFLGLKIKQFWHGTFLSQSKYYRELLKKFDMKNYKEEVTLITTGCYLDNDEKGAKVDQTKYKGLIVSLLYLTASRLYIMFSVCLCSRYQASPK